MKYTEFSLKYCDDIRQLINQAFQLSGMAEDPKDQERIIDIFLYAALSSTTFSRVAIDEDEKIRGVIFGEVQGKALSISKFYIYSRLLKLISILTFRMLFSQSLRKSFSFTARLLKAYKRMVNGRSYKGQAILFIVDKNCQGKGVGKTLMNELHKEMENNQVEAFYLFTDSYCTYQFYDNNGFERIGTEQVNYGEIPMDAYLYHKQVKEEKK